MVLVTLMKDVLKSPFLSVFLDYEFLAPIFRIRNKKSIPWDAFLVV